MIVKFNKSKNYISEAKLCSHTQPKLLFKTNYEISNLDKTRNKVISWENRSKVKLMWFRPMLNNLW